MRIKFVVSYLGFNYKGSQTQPNGQTIQDKIEEVLKKTFKQEIKVTLGSRTDSGVNAKGQVGAFDCDFSIDLEILKNALNKRLPLDIEIESMEEVSQDFHPRFSAIKKTYEYYFTKWEARTIEKKLVTYGLKKGELLDTVLLNEVCDKIVGEHDFQGFMSKTQKEIGTIRKIYSCQLLETNDGYIFRITGKSFLYNMVRIIVGSLLLVNEGKLKADIFDDISSIKRVNLGKTAPPNPLFLMEINY